MMAQVPGAGRRKTLAVLIAVMVVTAVSAAGAAAPATRQGPRIYVGEPRFDFGRVEEGARPEHNFEVKNVGDEPLIIKQVRPS